MVTINRLEIQGIRSFGPETHHLAQIDFSTPLTIITGQNGAGKTTIIESLLYVTAGEFPPTSNRGKTFICHPELIGGRDVKARISLDFNTASGMNVVSIRRMEAHYNKGALSFKSLPGHITKVINGEERSISSKCIDANIELVKLLGVSKAMLSHVIFCHQEDSHWPLADSDSVKKKFDEIFMLEKYVKALEALKANKKELNLNLKPANQTKINLQQTMEIAENLERRERKYEEEIDHGEKQIVEYKEKISELNEKVCEIHQLITDITRVTDKIQVVSQKMDILEARIPQSYRTLSRSQLYSFNDDSSTFDVEIEKLQQQQNILNFELQTLRNSYMQIERKIGLHEGEGLSLENQKKSLETNFIELKSAMINIFPSTVDLCLISNRDIIPSARNLLSELEIDLSAMEQTDSLQERTLELNKQEQIKKQARLEQSYSSQMNEMKSTELSLSQISGELSEITSLDQHIKLDQLDKNISRINNDLELHKQKFDISMIETEILQLETEMNNTENECKKLDIQAKSYEMHQTTMQVIDLKTQDAQRKKNEIREISNRINNKISSLLKAIPSNDKLLNQLKQLQEQETKEFQLYTNKLHDLNPQHIKIQARQKVIEDQIGNTYTKSIELRSQIREECGTSQLDICLQEAKMKKESYNETLVKEESSSTFSKLYLERIQTKNSCPACWRNFQSVQIKNDIIESHKIKITQVDSSTIDTAKQNLSQMEDRLAKLQSLLPNKEEIFLIEHETLPKLKKEFDNYQTEEQKLKKQIGSCESKRDHHQNNINLINNLLPDCTVLTEKYSELKILEEQIKKETVILGDFSSTSYDAFKLKLSKSQEELKIATMNKDLRHTLINNKRKERHALEDKLRELKTNRLEYTSKFQKQDNLKNKKNELEEKITGLKKSIDTAHQELGPSKSYLAKLELDLKCCKERNKTLHNDKKKNIDQLSRIIDVIQQKQTTYLDLSNKCSLSNINSYKTEKNDIKNKIENIEEKISMNNAQIDKMKHEKQELASTITNYKDAQTLFELYETKEKLENEKQRLTFKTSDPKHEHSLMTKQISDICSKRDKQSGQIIEKKESLRVVKRDLHSNRYKDITKQYLKKKYEIEAIEAICKLIEYNYEELDRSMMRFHREKIDQLNDLLREYWHDVYKGSDVDYIRITSNSEAGVTASGVRRYNYRVEMIKDDIGLDMRGRCSAGQKVLASILIRIALSQTFSYNCSIIALDEPSTNLDKDNVLSLAEALVKLSSRASRNKSKFQLILITHDLQFVNAFSHAEGVDHYWKLVKDGCFTRIERLSFI